MPSSSARSVSPRLVCHLLAPKHTVAHLVCRQLQRNAHWDKYCYASFYVPHSGSHTVWCAGWSTDWLALGGTIRRAKSRPFCTTGGQFFGCRIVAGYHCPQDNFIVYIVLFCTLHGCENTRRSNFGVLNCSCMLLQVAGFQGWSQTFCKRRLGTCSALDKLLSSSCDLHVLCVVLTQLQPTHT